MDILTLLTFPSNGNALTGIRKKTAGITVTHDPSNDKGKEKVITKVEGEEGDKENVASDDPAHSPPRKVARLGYHDSQSGSEPASPSSRAVRHQTQSLNKGKAPAAFDDSPADSGSHGNASQGSVQLQVLGTPGVSYCPGSWIDISRGADNQCDLKMP